MKRFFLLATVAIITLKISFTQFHSNSCQGNIFLHQNHVTYLNHATYSFIKIMETIIDKMESNRQRLLKKICHKVVSIVKDKDPSFRIKMHQRFIFIFFTICLDVIYLTCLPSLNFLDC